MAIARDWQSRLFALAVSVAWALLHWKFTSAAFYVIGGSILVLFVRSAVVPKSAKVVIAEIAGASMFIYLSHSQIMALVQKAFGEHHPWLELGLSLFIGIGIARFYIGLERRILQRYERVKLA